MPPDRLPKSHVPTSGPTSNTTTSTSLIPAGVT
jgi:hypothetical protein